MTPRRETLPIYRHGRPIGFGVERLCGCTVTFFGPGFPTLSGLHLVLAKVSTPFLTVRTRQVVKRVTDRFGLRLGVRHILYISIRVCQVYNYLS